MKKAKFIILLLLGSFLIFFRCNIYDMEIKDDSISAIYNEGIDKD